MLSVIKLPRVSSMRDSSVILLSCDEHMSTYMYMYMYVPKVCSHIHLYLPVFDSGPITGL